MGWRADGGLWLLVRGGGLYLSKGTGVCIYALPIFYQDLTNCMLGTNTLGLHISHLEHSYIRFFNALEF